MPSFRQMSVGNVRVGGITPLAAARAGTVNDAGGLATNIDCRNYKNVTLFVQGGVVGTSADCKLQASATSGGSYADVASGAIAQQVTGPFAVQLDCEVPAGKPWLQIVMVTVGATTVAAADLFAHGPTGVNRP